MTRLTSIAIGIAAAMALYSVAALSGVSTAAAQAPFNEGELIGLRGQCWSGSRQACIRFGMILGANHQSHADWRRAHPDWWEWERW